MPTYTIRALASLAANGWSSMRNVARDFNGRLWCAYRRTEAGDIRIFTAYSDDNGATWNEEAVSTVVGADQFDHTLAIDSSNNVHVVWVGLGYGVNVGNRNVIYRERITGVWQAEVQITDVAFNQEGPAIAIDSADDVHIVWLSIGGGTFPASPDVVYTKRTADVWGAVEMITDNNDIQYVASIAIGSDDGAYVAWFGRAPAAAVRQIWYRYRSASAVWGAIEQLTNGIQGQYWVCIAVDSNNYPHIVWRGRGHSVDFPFIDEIVYSYRLPAGWQPVELVTNVDFPQDTPTIAVDRSNDIHVIWPGQGWGANPGTDNIQHRIRTGGAWGVQTAITDVALPAQQAPSLLWATYPLLYNNPVTGYIFVWYDGNATYIHLSTNLSWIASPTVVTEPATNIEANSATLNGTLDDDGGEACDCGFEWGETVALGNTTSTQSGTTGSIFSSDLIGLSPNTRYYFRAFATNAAGTDYGDILGFLAPAAVMPSVITLPATHITEHQAQLNGMIENDGGDLGDIRFEWGGTTAYGNVTPWRGHFGDDYEFDETLDQLAEAAAFHFRAVFRNNLGTFYGRDMTFSTLGPLGPVVLMEDELAYLLEAT